MIRFHPSWLRTYRIAQSSLELTAVFLSQYLSASIPRCHPFFTGMVLYNSDWLWSCCAVKGDFDPFTTTSLVLRLQTRTTLGLCGMWMQALYLPGKNTDNWAISPAQMHSLTALQEYRWLSFHFQPILFKCSKCHIFAAGVGQNLVDFMIRGQRVQTWSVSVG